MATAAKVSQKELNAKFDDLKTKLKQIKSKEGKNDLYTHLQSVFKTLILHYPDQALCKLEEVSYLIKHSDEVKCEDFLKIQDMRDYKELCKVLKDYIKKLKDSFGGKKPTGEDEEDEEPEVPAPVGQVPDLLADANVY